MSRLVYVALLSAATLAACTKAPPAPPAPPATPAVAETPVPQPEVAPAAKPGGAVNVSSADLGTEVGADGRIVTAKENFAPNDTIILAITTTNPGTAPVSAQVTARWFGADGNVFNEESRQQDFSGTQAVDFRVADPKGFKPGKYKLEVALNGSTVQVREFAVQ